MNPEIAPYYDSETIEMMQGALPTLTVIQQQELLRSENGTQ
jgi:hypothetical protein